MKVTSYSFGEIEIDKKAYSSDCIVLKGKVFPNWWRKEGHRLLPDDLEIIAREKPKVLVVGCGASGVMQIPQATKEYISKLGIELVSADTTKACQIFNDYVSANKDVAGAFHLTC